MSGLPKFELISFALCPFVQRARTILLEKGIEHTVKYIDLSEPPAWFFDISPLEKVPVLLVDGEPLFESMVIVEYLDEITPGSLYPADPFKKAQNRSWIEYGNDILSTTFTLMTTTDEKEFKRAVATLDDRFDILEEDVLGEGPYFNGDNFSVVDAVYAPVFRFHNAIQAIEAQGLFEDRPLLTAWGENLLAHPAVKACVPDSYESDLDIWLKDRESILSAKMN